MGRSVTQLTDWITAVSTLLTAPVAVFSGLAAWFTYQGAKRNTSVLTEVRLGWAPGNFLKANLSLTNLDVEKIQIISIEIVSPKEIQLHKAVEKSISSYQQILEPDSLATKRLSVGWEVNQSGQEYSIDGHRFGGNKVTIPFYVRSSRLHPQQMLKFRLRYSTSSLSVRNKALLARAIIPAAPSKSTDDKVSSNI